MIITSLRHRRKVRELSTEKPLDLKEFDDLFVAANSFFRQGNYLGLKCGIDLLIESLECSGEFTRRIKDALRELTIALDCYEWAYTKGSSHNMLTRDLIVLNRDTAIARALPHMRSINEDLKARGLGCPRQPSKIPKDDKKS